MIKNTEEQKEFLRFMYYMRLVSRTAINRPISKKLWFFGKMLMNNDIVAFQSLYISFRNWTTRYRNNKINL